MASWMASSLLSGGVAAMMRLKGAASSLVPCQASSGGPGQGQLILCLATWISWKPARQRRWSNLFSSAKRKTCGASGGGGGASTYFREGLVNVLEKGVSSMEHQVTKETRPPGLRTRRISPRAF